jgi:hypothetical protein
MKFYVKLFLIILRELFLYVNYRSEIYTDGKGNFMVKRYK